MARFELPAPDQAPVESQPLLQAVAQRIGFTPNSHRLLSISPPVLAGFMALQSSLSKTLDLKTRNGIALAVSEANGCGYCLAAHTHAASVMAKTAHTEIALNRVAASGDSKRAAALRFARQLVDTRGKVSDEALEAVRSAGFSDKQIIEIVALTVQFLFTNFMNNMAESDVDFPTPEAAITT